MILVGYRAEVQETKESVRPSQSRPASTVAFEIIPSPLDA
jgi:hypothetical protein